jgi:hypothetical protein
MPTYPFIYGSNRSQSVIADNEQTMNLYVEAIDSPGAPSRAALYPTPGFVPQITLPSDVGGRALFNIGGRTFGVIGASYAELFPADRTATTRGTVAQDAQLAQIVTNGAGGQQLIASGSNAYLHTLATNAFAQVLTGEATQIGMLDTFFLAFNASTGRLRISGSNDGTTWDPTQFALRSQQPDPWRAMIVNAPDIWLLGEQTSDVWFDAGGTPFPFTPRAGLSIPYGISAPFSVATSGGSVLWLAKNRDGAGLVVMASGYSAVPISTAEVTTTIASYARSSKITDAEGLVYQEAGHVFYVLRFPSAGATWVYDLTTKVWAERGKWLTEAAPKRYGVWAPRVRCYSQGLHLTAEDGTGIISVMDSSYGTETDGAPIRRLRRGPVLVNEHRRVPLGRFELSLEVGLGVATGQGLDPQVLFRGSSDGGQTWGNERAASAGPMGAYRQRVFWTRLGAPRLWVPEVTMSDPIPWRIMEAYVNNDPAAAAQAGG